MTVMPCKAGLDDSIKRKLDEVLEAVKGTKNSTSHIYLSNLGTEQVAIMQRKAGLYNEAGAVPLAREKSATESFAWDDRQEKAQHDRCGLSFPDALFSTFRKCQDKVCEALRCHFTVYLLFSSANSATTKSSVPPITPESRLEIIR